MVTNVEILQAVSMQTENFGSMIEIVRDIHTRVTGLETTVSDMSGKVGVLEARVGTIESRFSTVESRIGTVETRLGSVESNLSDNCKKLDKLQKDVTEIKDKTLYGLSKIMESYGQNHEALSSRVDKLEDR